MSTTKYIPCGLKGPVPAVSKKSLSDAVNLYHDMEGQGSIGRICAVCATVAPMGPLISPNKMRTGFPRYMSLVSRFLALHDVLESAEHYTRIVAEKQFPADWIRIAAKSPLTVAGGFDATLFTWPSTEKP